MKFHFLSNARERAHKSVNGPLSESHDYGTDRVNTVLVGNELCTLYIKKSSRRCDC